MRDKNTTVLVTGATGFLAQHLIPYLSGKGANVAGISLKKTPSKNFKSFLHINADLKDKAKINEIIKDIQPNKIFHLASYPDKEPSFENTDECIQNNIQGTLNLIHALKDVSYESFIHIGSYKEYAGNKSPFKEDSALFPLSSYAISKASAEMFCMSYYQLYKFPITSIRFPTLYGPAQPHQNLIPHIINTVLSGNNLKLTKGGQKRELLYVSDAVAALDLAASSKGVVGEIINIGTDKDYLIKEIVTEVLKLTNSKTMVEWGAIPYRKNEIWAMRGDTKKAKTLLNWVPKVSLREGLIKTIAYYKNAKRKNKN